MLEKIIILILRHLIGDYVLQSDFIAKTKQNAVLNGQYWTLSYSVYKNALPI